MSGNICRCSAYPNIVAAIREVAEEAAHEALHATNGPSDVAAACACGRAARAPSSSPAAPTSSI